MENLKEQFARLYMELDLTDKQAAMINKLQKDVDAALRQPPVVSCCAVLEELQLKLIAMSCFAQEHFNEKAYDITKMNIDEIRHWIKKKRSQH